MTTYDKWISTEPLIDYDPEYREEDEEDEIPEPVVDEVWDGARGEYIFEVTFASGKQFTIVQARAGAFVGDYEIHGDDFYSDGFLSPEAAIDRLIDMVMS